MLEDKLRTATNQPANEQHDHREEDNVEPSLRSWCNIVKLVELRGEQNGRLSVVTPTFGKIFPCPSDSLALDIKRLCCGDKRVVSLNLVGYNDPTPLRVERFEARGDR